VELSRSHGEGDSRRKEKGAFTTIPMAWNEASQTLTIGERQGGFPGTLRDRTFNVVFVNAGHGVGVDVADHADQVVKYSRRPVSISVPK
jgi:alpha-D-xyloside xylohydrolase